LGHTSGGDKSKYITIDTVTVTGCTMYGLYFLGGDHISIINSTISNIATTDHNQNGDGIYFGCDSSNNPVTNVSITNNTFTGSFGRGALVLTGCITGAISGNFFTPTATGLSYVMDLEPNGNQTVSGIQISNNTFDYSLINISPIWVTGGASGSTVSSIDVFGNTFNLHSVGNSMYLGFKNATGTSCIYDNTFNNIISDGISITGTSTMTVLVYRNLINGSLAGTAIAFQAGTIGSIYYNILKNVYAGVYCAPKAACLVYNNTIVNQTTTGLNNYGAMTARNNIISTNSSNSSMRFINEKTNATGSYNYNIFNSPNRKSALFAWHGLTYSLFADYKSASRQDSHSIQSNPLFVSSVDVHLQPSSPAINAGIDVGLTTDYEGKSVSNGSNPEIGAYQLY
jgi:hypothetical protein